MRLYRIARAAWEKCLTREAQRLSFLAVLLLLMTGSAIAADPPATQPAEYAIARKFLLQALAPRPDAQYQVLVDPPGINSKAWLAANQEAVNGTQPSKLAAMPWGLTRYHPAAKENEPSKLYLLVADWHASGNVIVYGLNAANVKRAYLLASPDKELKFHPLDRNLVVEATAKNAKAPDPLITTIVLELAGEPKVLPIAVAQSLDGPVLLHAKDAIVVAQNLRYEPEPIKNTLGYWTNPKDGAYWEFTIDKPGMFDVELLQGCGKNSGGSTIEVTIDQNPPLPMVVQDTGHFQNFVPRVIGQVKLEAGKHRLQVAVKEKKGAAVMDLRQVTLKPVK